ncbi:hypothetical protein LTR53_020416, partial [Teratosphaeriaceae sp. CCFEE 6253]
MHDDFEGGGGFLAEHEEDHVAEPEDGGLLVEDHAHGDKQPPKGHAPITPVSLQSLHQDKEGADTDSDDTEMGDKDEEA